MGSRIKDDVTNFYLCFCEIARPESSEREAWIIQRFPDAYKDEQVLRSVPKFAYPCEFEKHDPKTETALVFLSHLPWYEIFVKLLNSVAEIIRTGQAEELDSFLDVLLHSQVPEPGVSLTISYNNNQCKFVCQSPEQFSLPKIPDNRNLTEYYSAVDNNNMITVFASMLYERRVVFVSRRFDRLSACVQSANAILYPMHWQHIYIPVLPTHLIDYLLAPMPFLIGVPTTIWQSVKKSDVGDVVVLDVDSNVMQTPFGDVDSLPPEVVKFLKSQLKNRAALLNDGFARVFLRALVLLIGGYRDALKFHQGQKITFSETAFIESRPPTMQFFLKDMLHLQIFQQFIEERLDMLNAGLGFSDEFELEACNYSDKSSNKIKAQYKEWVSTMHRQGTAFFKTVKNKANPAVKSAVKSVKERGKDVKTAYRGIRSKMKKEMAHTTSLHSVQQPRSAPSSPTTHRARPMTFNGAESVVAQSTFRKQKRSGALPTRSSKEYLPLSPPSDDLMSPEAACAGAGLSLPSLDMDLMGDMVEVMNKKCALLDSPDNLASPPVDRTLKPMRSWDAFSREPFGDATSTSQSRHTALSSTASLPLPTNPFAFPLFPPQQNPFMPDVVQTSLDPPCRSAPTLSNKPRDGDLIRLDSIPSEESFDPLSPDTPIAFPTGLTNPLYPYCKLKSEQSVKKNVNKSFLHSQSNMNHGRFNKHDLDLLKEYGIEFQPNVNVRTEEDPFQLVCDNSVMRSQRNWATFD